MQNQNDQRGNIVRVEGELRVLSPQRQAREQEERIFGTRDNGLEETICTMRLRHNIADPQRADVYNPRGGRITSLNRLNLPILAYLRLSAERGVLYRVKTLILLWLKSPHQFPNIVQENCDMHFRIMFTIYIWDDYKPACYAAP